MAKVHFINVDPGDCSIIQHNRGRTTMIDICDGYLDQEQSATAALIRSAMGLAEGNPRGNFQMKDERTNPIDYAEELGISSVWRFILTHPDMDHMDGLDALCNRIGISNFWHTGVIREKPPFNGGRFYEEDWERYANLKAGSVAGVTTLTNLAGARFPFANRDDSNGNGPGDGLSILAPGKALVSAASDGDINDGSYVILYRSSDCRVLFPGDAHDATWEYVLEHYANLVEGVEILIAPHHGRGSDRSYDFLDHIKPQFTLFGNAPSEHLDYDAWRSRDLPFITSNQAGNMVLEIENRRVDIYIQNEAFAAAGRRDLQLTNSQGYVFWGSVVQE